MQIELNFKINKYYLLAHALKSSHSPFNGWINLPNKLWSISGSTYWFLFNPSRHDIAFTNIKDNDTIENFIEKITEDSKKIFNIAFKSKEFVKLHKETKEYLKKIQKEWDNKKEEISSILEEILGENLPNIKINVFVTHPALANGIALPELNIICWGHRENWPNYSMVYLMHEAMHLILDKKLGRGDLTHAIIELITDQELRIQLNKKGHYFVESQEPVGHKHLFRLSKMILPYWKKYLKNKNKNISEFYSDIIKIPKIKNSLSLRLTPNPKAQH